MANTLKFGAGQWATKEGSTLAYNDENGNFKPLPFTFERSTSATRVNKQGLIEVVSNNEPRIDFTNDSNGALLLEPSRSNVFLNSNKFDTTWQGNYTVLTSGQVGVGGSTDAWMLSGFAGTSQEKRIRQYPPSPGIYTVSVYAKAGTVDYLWLRGVTSSANKRTFFNLSTGQIGLDSAVSSSMIDMGDGWYRCEAVFNQQSGFEFYIGLSDTENAATSTTGNIYIQYAQAEQGSYATSYIPTQGSIATRSAEVCSQTVPDGVIGQTEGTVFIETKLAQEIPSSSGYFSISDGTANNSYIVQFRNNGTLRIYQNGLDGSNLAFVDSNINLSKNNKIAFKYEQSISSMTLYINGVEISLLGGFVYENTTGINNIKMAYVSGSLNLYSEINDIKLYNKALSNAELQALTS